MLFYIRINFLFIIEVELKFKKFFIYAIICVLAVTSGVLVGDLYLDTILPFVDTFSTQEADIRDDEKGIQKLYESAISGKKTSFSAVELYQIGEYKLKNQKSFMKILKGDVVSMGAHQQLRSNKVMYNNEIFYLKMSPSSMSMAPSMAVWMNYELGGDTVLLAESRNKSDIVGDNPENFDILLGREDATTWSIEKYRNFFKTDITTPLTYIISSNTTAEGIYSKNVTLNEQNQYVFEITLNREYASYAALYYSFEITHFLDAKTIPTTPPQSGSDLPKWDSVKIVGTLDENFNFVKLEYVENYRVNQIIPDVPVTNTLTDTFIYDENEIRDYLESIGEL